MIFASPAIVPSLEAITKYSPLAMSFVLNEIASTVTTFSYDGVRGVLSKVETVSTLPAGFSGNNSTAQIAAHPNGRFVYASNRGHDSIAIFAFDDSSGRLSVLGHEPTQGRTPRNFNLDPSGTYLLAANQNSDEIVVFNVDRKTGRLTDTNKRISVGNPVCVKWIMP